MAATKSFAAELLVLNMLGFAFAGIQLKMNIYLPHFSSDAKQLGLGINMWTINDAPTMQACLESDAGIITNYPDVAVSLRNRMK